MQRIRGNVQNWIKYPFFNLFAENFLKEKTEENKLIINNLNSSV